MKFLVLFVITCFTFVGCVKRKHNEGNASHTPNSSVFLSDADLQPAVLPKKPAWRVESQMQNGIGLFANYPDSNEPKTEEEVPPQETNDFERCSKAQLADTKIMSKGNEVWVDWKIDYKACLGKQETDEFNSKLTEQKMRFSFYFFCSTVDFSSLNGKNFLEIESKSKEFEAMFACTKPGSTKKELSNTELVSRFTVNGKESHYVTRSASMTSDKQACAALVEEKRTKDLSTCVSTDISYLDNEVKSYERVEKVSLVRPMDSQKPFFESGTINYQYGDWKGTVVYQNADTPPKWKMSNGKESLEGVVTTDSKASSTETMNLHSGNKRSKSADPKFRVPYTPKLWFIK